MFILLREHFHFVYFSRFNFHDGTERISSVRGKSPRAKSPHAQRFIYRLATNPANR